MRLGFIYAIGAAVLWGLVYAIDQKILSKISPASLLFVDSILATLLLLPVVIYNKGSLSSVLNADWPTWRLIIIAMALATSANLLIFSAIKAMDANIASIIEIAYPFFVVFFSYIIFHSTPNIYFFIGGVLIFIGSAVIIKLA